MSVYMIRCGAFGHVKIGYTNAPQKRLAELQIAHWERLHILRLFEGGEAEEGGLHVLFADNNIRGEWYSFTRKMLEDVGLIEILPEAQVAQENIAPKIEVLLPNEVPSAVELGERFRSLRKARGLRQDDAASAFGINRTTLIGLEQGAHYPSLSTLLRASKLFGVPLTMEPIP